jgi:hypothetical protein
MAARATIPALSLVLATACAFNPAPVPVYGTDPDVSALSGEWTGEYWSAETGRSGSVFFRLTGSADSASGHVLMVPADGVGHNHPDDVHPMSEYIPISFVQVRAGHVEGNLDPYRDPVCGCRLHTSFEGSLRDGTIEGTFRTRHIEGGMVQEGRWRVTRREPR